MRLPQPLRGLARALFTEYGLARRGIGKRILDSVVTRNDAVVMRKDPASAVLFVLSATIADNLNTAPGARIRESL